MLAIVHVFKVWRCYLTGAGVTSRRPALPVASPCPVNRVALLAVASPCCPHTALLPARRPALPVLSRPAARTALLRAALLLAPPCCCPPRCAQPCWPAPCCPRAALLAAAPLPASPCPCHPDAARPAVRCPAGKRPAACAPPCWQPHRPALPMRRPALPCPGCAPLFPTNPPPLPALRASLVLARRPACFDTWLDDLQLYLLSDSRDSVLLFDHTSGASLAPPTTADSATRSQWLTLARYSSPATAALGRLILPYLFPELSAFATVKDLVTHLRTSDSRYRASLPAEFLDRNPPLSTGCCVWGCCVWGSEPASAEPGGAEPKGAEPRGAESEGAESGGAKPKGAEPGGAESEGAESGGAKPRGTASSGVLAGARGTGGAGAAGPGGARTSGTGAAGAGGVGGAGAGDLGAGGTAAFGLGSAGATAGARGTRGAGAPGPGGARTRGTGAAGVAGVGGAGAGDPGAGGAGAGCAGASGPGAGRTVQWRHFFVPPLPSSLPPPNLRQADSPLPAPSPYTEQTDSLTERREPESRPASPVRAVCIGRGVPRPHPPPVPVTHIMALRPSSVPLGVPMPSPHSSSLPDVLDPESDLARAASPTIPRLLATDPLFESTAASALVAELVQFVAACRLDYATSLVAESESDCPPSVGGECALGTDVLADKQEDFECLAAAVPHLMAMLLAPEGDPDAPHIPTLRSYA
ncbi:unnamed protein product [Closterium sp. NIES-54]